MSRALLMGLGAIAALFSAPGYAASRDVTVAADPDCEVVRILPNGRRVVRPPVHTSRNSGRRGGPAHASAASSGRGSASSSVSATSSSGGRSHASASSRSSGGGRTVTTTSDENGCRVVIDLRRQGE